MEFDELANRVIVCAMSPGLRAESSASSSSFVLFVFFVVKQFCTSEPGIDFSCNLV